MITKISKKNKYLFIFLIITIINCSILVYGKSIDINGVRVSENVVVSKMIDNQGKNVNEINNFNTEEYEKTINEKEDRYVYVELCITNNNSNEVANVVIEEICPNNFYQADSKKIDEKINIKIESNAEKTYKYKYGYKKRIYEEQKDKIKYDENGNIIYDDNDIDVNTDIKNNKDNIVNKKTQDSVHSDIIDGSQRILIFLIVFVLSIILLLVFLMFYRTIKSHDEFFRDKDEFSIIIIYLFLISLVVNIFICKNEIYSKDYKVQLYEYGKSYEKVIYESAIFNDVVYRFAYKITVVYESNYEITDEDYERDTDGDGLVDALEYLYMTDKNKKDTDYDGLSDYIEVMFLDYNPLSDDTFNDGIKDGDRDYDGDVLTNIEEINYGTDLTNEDTDYDEINDYDEILKYGTNPLNIDTDDDLLSDNEEIKLGLNPTKPRTDGITLDSERLVEQVYEMSEVPEELKKGDIYIKNIEGEVAGIIDNAIRVKAYQDENITNSNSITGLVFKVENENDFELNITLEASKVSDRVKYLIVVKCENNTFIPINTICKEDELIAKVTSGIYAVVDSDLLLRDINIYNKDYD